MGLYSNTGAFNVALNDTTGSGRYSASGALRIKLVSGSSYVGLYDADGSLNVVDVSGVSINTYGGLYHPSGALRCRIAPGTFSGTLAPDGSYYFNGLFSPLDLFSAGEEGVWYDPSDFSTMFQTSSGNTPVTTVEQPVGLLLDKSKGMALGSELITNGTFNSDLTGWTIGTNLSVIWEAGKAKITRSGAITASAAFEVNFTTVVGRVYKVQFTFSGTGTGAAFGIFNGASAIFGPSAVGNGSFTYYFVATGTTSQLNFWCNDGQTVLLDDVSVKNIAGNHAYQTTSASRPILKIDSNNKYHLFFDGIDDSFSTATFNPNTNKLQIFAGVRKLSDVAQGVLLETNSVGNGRFAFFAPNGAAANNYQFVSFGTSAAFATISSQVAPITNVISGLSDIASPFAIVRNNGVVSQTSTATQGTGNYLNNPLYIGRRGGTTLPYNGHLYGLIIRFSTTNLDAATISNTETWINGKTMAY